MAFRVVRSFGRTTVHFQMKAVGFAISARKNLMGSSVIFRKNIVIHRSMYLLHLMRIIC